MNTSERLQQLARNLYWTWHPEVIEIFRDLNPELWREVNHNPLAFLSRLSQDQIEAGVSTLDLEARINHAFHQMHYHNRSRETWGRWYAGGLYANPVAYFSAEFGLHESLPLYSGGLGVLAGDHLKGASDLGLPLVGIGLFYAQGYFTQRLDEEGWQREEYPDADVDYLPLSRVRDSAGNLVQIQVETADAQIVARLWEADVGRCRLILLDTNVKDNPKSIRQLTAQLYGGDEETRIRQEVLLGIGGMRALRSLGILPGVLHMNEGHSAFAALELARQLMERDGRGWEDVHDRVIRQTVFTSHTPSPAGHDRFPPELLLKTLDPLRQQLSISPEELLAMGRVDPKDDDEPFCMTVLALRMAASSNGVSARHREVTQSMWRGVWPDQPAHEIPIGHVTNGVHVASWLSTSMSKLFDRYLGEDWDLRMDDPHTWSAVEDIDEVEFWEQHQILKTQLVDYVARCVACQANRGMKAKQTSVNESFQLSPSILTIGFARRFAPYKRAELLFRDLDRLDRIVNSFERPIQLIFAGKAHPDNEPGKQSIQRILEVAQDQRFADRVVFLENYDINMCRHLVQGVDVWLNTPRRPMEACGTSGQKVVLNGGVNLSILDGWWDQAYDGTNGFAIGDGSERADPQQQDAHDAECLYQVLEEHVVPLFYQRDEQNVPRDWIAIQKSGIRSLAPRFNSRRMLLDYATSCYLPAGGVNVRSSRFV